jgi:hypothetical protein
MPDRVAAAAGGRPQIDADLRTLIPRVGFDNPLWGAPRIHGEWLKLGFESRSMERGEVPGEATWLPSQERLTFLRNHSTQIAAMDLFVLPSVTFELLYVFIIVGVARRGRVWINATAHPTADWITHQMTEAFPWNDAPPYLIRDRHQVYGTAVTPRLRAIGIRTDHIIVPIAPRCTNFPVPRVA